MRAEGERAAHTCVCHGEKTDDGATQSRGRRRNDRAGLSRCHRHPGGVLGLARRHGTSESGWSKRKPARHRERTLVSSGKRRFPQNRTGREADAGGSFAARKKQSHFLFRSLHSRRQTDRRSRFSEAERAGGGDFRCGSRVPPNRTSARVALEKSAKSRARFDRRSVNPCSGAKALDIRVLANDVRVLEYGLGTKNPPVVTSETLMFPHPRCTFQGGSFIHILSLQRADAKPD